MCNALILARRIVCEPIRPPLIIAILQFIYSCNMRCGQYKNILYYTSIRLQTHTLHEHMNKNRVSNATQQYTVDLLHGTTTTYRLEILQ